MRLLGNISAILVLVVAIVSERVVGGINEAYGSCAAFHVSPSLQTSSHFSIATSHNLSCYPWYPHGARYPRRQCASQCQDDPRVQYSVGQRYAQVLFALLTRDSAKIGIERFIEMT